MIQAAGENSAEPIYLNPEPKTFQAAIKTCKPSRMRVAGDQDFSSCPMRFRTAPPLDRECFGWTKVSGRELCSLHRNLRPPSDALDGTVREILRTEEYYAIVYEFDPNCQLGMDLRVI
ncbi:hypothetical protein B0T25DRAFT_133165 [Lasiosphaeria hispida]|uniref:Uncharacterized protein n=1 Tax=Lasiosphaeria hispida TaxID=260671 RepID=A0AAJ0HSQ1_9PEZI|nr:hypothetical protein B0T25DRAFT_133165 [Lasiosphaeria hispida]